MNTHTLAELKQRQALPLEVKVLMSKQRQRVATALCKSKMACWGKIFRDKHSP